MIIQNPVMILVCLFSIPFIYRAFKADGKNWKAVAGINACIIVVLGVAASSPALQEGTQVLTNKNMVYLNDKSASMMGVSQDVNIDEVSVQERVIASGNTLDLGKSIVNSVKEDQTYLVKSDLRGVKSPQKIINVFQEHNSSLYFVKPELPEETSVILEGPSETVPGAENRFTATISSTKDNPKRIDLYVDGEKVKSEKTSDEITLEREFQNKGYHRIEARIIPSDKYGSNNRYYKSVRVVDKPQLLLLGEEGELYDRLSEFYNIDVKASLPDNISNYHAIIMKKNIDASTRLENYLINGNGLVYTGDQTMDVLPVRQDQDSRDTSNPKIAVGIDISTGIGENLKRSKNYSTRFLASLKQRVPGTEVGVFAYNSSIIGFGRPKPLADNSYYNRLLSIRDKVPPNGLAHQIKSLRHAKEVLEGSPGNIVLMTDLEIPGDGGVKGRDLDEISNLQESGVRLYSRQDYVSAYLDEVSSLRNDVRLHVVITNVADQDYSNRINLDNVDSYSGTYVYKGFQEFENQIGSRIRGGGGSDERVVSVFENNQFITKDIEDFSLAVSDVSQVETKESGDRLLVTSGNRPVLSSWRFGLGRVAAYSAGPSDLKPFLAQEPGVVSKSVAWAVGEPTRKNDKYLEVISAREDQDVVVSSNFETGSLKRKPGGMFETRIKPESLGFHVYKGSYDYTYNYNSELEDFGYRSDVIETISDRTGGKILEPDNLSSITSEINTTSTERTSYTSLTPYLLSAGLLLFLLQVGYRKRNGLI